MGRTVVQPRLRGLSRYLDLAVREGFWFEAIEPAYPEHLDQLPEYFTAYRKVVPKGRTVAVHGPYYDIVLHSPDPQVRRLSETRVRESLRWAKELGADYLILHTNHIPLIREPTYDAHWLAAHIDFFAGLPADSVTVLLENMWDPSPDLAVRLVEELGSDRLRLCFDVAHWNVHATVSMREWFARAGAYTPYVQLGDNNGDCDADLAIGSGTVDWAEFDRCLRRYAPDADGMVGVGIDDGSRLDRSLAYLRQHQLHPFGVEGQRD